ncbi:AraC family transcriptional regulator [Lactococcus allomyrinae]|uniref:AraC family transcriptional regulator n=1 Tax=Lactococcus allomyrinae TaxID=2419773 RepID=A0A387BRK7_9LACT|nr:AraC family transcriptional regulator [Lactococcus allomyrinae]AYG01101.1 AraC family transcriptional regulator [Lactococcus allomyrinae]
MTFTIEHKNALTLHGWTVKFDGISLATWETIDEVRRLKSEHFINLAKTENFPEKMANSLDGFGYAIGENRTDGFYYFAGVNSAIQAPDCFDLPESDYVILTAKGGNSRTLFDQLNTELFADILPQLKDTYDFIDGFVVEVITAGTPLDAEVELRFPVNKK